MFGGFSGDGCRHWSLESGVCGTGVSPSHTHLQVSLLLILLLPKLDFLKIFFFWPGESIEMFAICVQIPILYLSHAVFEHVSISAFSNISRFLK
jgi:hypothetical protein